MQWFKEIKRSEPVMAACPLCGMVIPLFMIHVKEPSWFGRRVQVRVEGDATDWVAHIWTHNSNARV